MSDIEAKKKAFMDSVASTMLDAVRLKTVMLKKGLTRAKAKCPECAGHLQGALVGPKKHMRFWCDGTCNRQMME